MHKVGCLEPSVGGHVLASSSRHGFNRSTDEGGGRAQDCEVFIQSRTKSSARELRQDVTGETVRQDAKDE